MQPISIYISCKIDALVAIIGLFTTTRRRREIHWFWRIGRSLRSKPNSLINRSECCNISCTGVRFYSLDRA